MLKEESEWLEHFTLEQAARALRQEIEKTASRSFSRNGVQIHLNQKEHEEGFLKILADFEVEIGRKTMFDFFLPD